MENRKTYIVELTRIELDTIISALQSSDDGDYFAKELSKELLEFQKRQAG